MKFEIACNELEGIRDGEVVYRGRFGRYGTLGDLVGEGLVSGYVADGDDCGYGFALVADGGELLVSGSGRFEESVDGTPVKVISFFADESGVIRARLDPAKPADVTSDRLLSGSGVKIETEERMSLAWSAKPVSGL